MQHYKKASRYWRDSLVDQQFSKGKYKHLDLATSFIQNTKNISFRINSKTVLKKLSSFEEVTMESLYVPFCFKKLSNHSKLEKDYRPEVLFPITIKAQISENGFVYPIENPIIPRDLLLPLDTEDFYIGNMEDYDLFVTQHEAPSFGFEASSGWEDYYSKNIEATYRSGLLRCLLEERLIDAEQANGDFKSLLKVLRKNKARKNSFTNILNHYNEKWDKTIEDTLNNDEGFNKVIEAYVAKWEAYLEYVEKLLDAIIPSKDVFEAYEKVNAAYFTNVKFNASFKITAVYEDLYTREEATDLSLYRNYTTIEQENEIPVLDSNRFFSKRLGHNNNLYPLADAQRTAVSALLSADKGEILAVNGPPGTGKTTMLLSVVASLWVDKAIKAAEPPVIIANSTNNQAVTNIIDAFAKDFSTGDGDFAGRWIDGLNSFGSYFVAKGKRDEAKEKGYLTEDVLCEMETEAFFSKAKTSFLQKSQKAFNNKNLVLEASVAKLHKLLLDKKLLLNRIEESYSDYLIFGKEISLLLRVDYKDEEEVKEACLSHDKHKGELAFMEMKWEEYLASENMFLAVFSFLPFVKRKRIQKAKVFARQHDFNKHLQLEDLDVHQLQFAIQSRKEEIATASKKLDLFTIARSNCIETLNKLETGICPDKGLIEIDKLADTKIRFEMFLIATHYWEGRWLLEMEQMIENDQLKSIEWSYKNIRENNWKRRMKLTPCAVMTFFMLPDYFIYSRKIHDSLSKEEYLYDFIDLLIVDEAGQVSPEVAGAGFALAKKALIIGDTLQIPPINKLTKSIDIGNLHKAGLLSKDLEVAAIDKAYRQLQFKGIASNIGSVMKISQNRSKYYPEKKLERGLFLYEHRRCYDSIIAFCNELCYKGVLIPMRGDAPDNPVFSSMGYLNIEGKCENAQGSKKNELEAKIIAGWIISNYNELKKTYPDKEIQDIVAVVTPFRAQALRVAYHLKQARDTSIKEALSKITVGTVHSLQGAEREVILFSPTYSRHNNGGFIDNDKSMLNVAVSRAKDSFLVFGDMSIFNQESVSPTGILAKYLFEHENNALSYVHQYSELFAREDLISKEHPLQILTDHKEHDAFLKNLFHEAKQRIIIVSPWLTYAIIEENGYDTLLANTKIKIRIYTDKWFNTFTHNKRDKKKEESFDLTLKKLEDMGVDVKIANNLHSKMVFKDNDCLCIGSFNWFSAQRSGYYINAEHSAVYQGENVKEEIEHILKQLRALSQ